MEIAMTAQPGRRERKRQQTLDHLADTAWQLFQTEGFESVTMEAIAEAADVAKGTLYKYFPVKEALLRHRFHRELAADIPQLLNELTALPSAAERLRAFLIRSADWSTQHREFIGHYLRLRSSEMGVPYHLDGAGRSGIEAIFTRFIAQGQESGEFRADLDTTAAAHYLEFLYLAALMRWLNDAADDLHREFDTMLALYLRGMQP
jgi:AcrR family transcriptional regulator